MSEQPYNDVAVDVLIEQVRGQLEEQPWYKQFSNTTTSAVGAVVVLIWSAAYLGFDIPTEVTAPVYAVIGLLTVFGVYKTPNGVTQKQVEQLEVTAESIGRHRL